MSINQEVELLRRIPMFSKIDPAKLRLLAFASERVTFPAGEILFHQGDPADAAYLIIDGSVSITVELASGPLLVAKVGKDQIVGEIGIICDVPRTATVTAEQQTVTLKITRDLFFQMINDFPVMGVEIMRVLAHRLEHTTAQLRNCQQRLNQLEHA
ncbi:MAG TPA: Crp/Fnr family transcriptional regulator [Hypericibacter adhaerens]|jgi:CRP-like cAMP-binding protein|uniref:Cyclic nucleotide-binding protein n=1 Tax=Hypericibacter adhaerens TaxID=2602016 RepID=A0A5J6N508_9PROT|nr:Crp/Fnr family transcriptional regulator [Hypericibacter adhaerens]QEX25152.1 cyclic nucleotide-binding protein [Hypericibacter adhaerens]HWA42033.1 Crp/Fnr family transcriptional regulator [Hypericibacter adhaerens]